MLKIEVFAENESIEPRVIAAKGDKPSRTIYEQIAYAYLGGKFPVEMKISLQDGQPAYKAGLYTVHPSSFLVNNFGGLEIKRFGMQILPLEMDI
uniref:single-stranded DNA-binding protein n=1 Tax=Thaumasiovibrio occultus TaxID=1891184 RepID=UPI000B35B744|nr:single-stranded DNA-binding protein [Thaumasiovibrio occultus]